jgi:hypothetical protein
MFVPVRFTSPFRSREKKKEGKKSREEGRKKKEKK